MIKKCIIVFNIVFVIFIICLFANVQVNGYEFENEKIYCTATIDDNFADDVVIVVLTKEATFSFKDYTKNDFTELGEVEVEEITKGTTEIVKDKYLYNIDREGHALKISDDYRRIYKITLLNKGKEQVLEAIKILEKRNDIQSAEPSYSGGETMSIPTEYSLYQGVCPEDNGSKKWWIDMIELDKVWNLNINSSNIVVGVIDSGIDFTHPDLSGKKSHIDGIDFTGGNNNDIYGHGTCVASYSIKYGRNNIIYIQFTTWCILHRIL